MLILQTAMVGCTGSFLSVDG